MDFVHVRNEEAGVFAAVADAYLTGQPVVVCGTSGPGAVHLLALLPLVKPKPDASVLGEALAALIQLLHDEYPLSWCCATGSQARR